MSDSLRPPGLQHASLPCPSLSPGVCSNSCPLSQWCHPAVSSSVALFSFWPSIFPCVRDFSNELTLCIRWREYRSFSISPSDEYSGLISFRIYWFDFLESKGLSRVFSKTLVMIVSGKQQRDLVIHIHVSILPQNPFHPGWHITLSRVPCAIQ